MTRRHFLGTTASAALTAGPLGRLLGAEPSGYGPFRMGIQSYSLRHFPLAEALKLTRESLGLEWWEAFEAHIPITDDFIWRSEARMLLKENHIKLRTFGVVGFGGDANKNRRVFEFAKAMGIETLSADPTPEAFDSLDKLTEEYGINIAIHNHGPGARYDKIDSVWNAVKNRSKRIGACIDTGHYLRSKEDPVKAIEIFGERTFGFHLKDVKDATKFTILGKGDLRLTECLRLLKKLPYKGILSLEYEESEANPIPDMQVCLQAVCEAVKKI